MTIKISGREYVTVAERVQDARDAYSIEGSEIFTIGETGRWWYRATIRVGDRQFVGTAEIKFKGAKPGSAAATSPVQCGETAAVGRALAFAGYGTTHGIASAEEMLEEDAVSARPAMDTSDPERRLTAEEITALKSDVLAAGVSWRDVVMWAPQACGRTINRLQVQDAEAIRTLLVEAPSAFAAEQGEPA